MGNQFKVVKLQNCSQIFTNCQCGSMIKVEFNSSFIIAFPLWIIWVIATVPGRSKYTRVTIISATFQVSRTIFIFITVSFTYRDAVRFSNPGGQAIIHWAYSSALPGWNRANWNLTFRILRDSNAKSYLTSTRLSEK